MFTFVSSLQLEHKTKEAVSSCCKVHLTSNIFCRILSSVPQVPRNSNSIIILFLFSFSVKEAIARNISRNILEIISTWNLSSATCETTNMEDTVACSGDLRNGAFKFSTLITNCILTFLVLVWCKALVLVCVRCALFYAIKL